jgi:hypothetical protein
MKIFSEPPPPPPSFRALSDFNPSPEECNEFLTVRKGDIFGLASTPRTSTSHTVENTRQELRDCVLVLRLSGPVSVEKGFVRSAHLEAIRAREPSPPRPDFEPFLRSKVEALDMLRTISGLWKDDRLHPKIYTLTLDRSRGLNVLSELSNGSYRTGKSLIRVKPLTQDIHAILWGESFCLSADTTSHDLKWLPIQETRHQTWKWVRISGRQIAQ